MNIFHVSSEYAPLIKVGGLADVVSALTKNFALLNHRVEVILPFYSFIKNNSINKTFKFSCNFINKIHFVEAYQTKYNGCFLTFLKKQNSSNCYFSRPSIYGYKDDVKRFCWFSTASYEYLCLLKKSLNIDIVHVHDWHGGLLLGLIQNSLYLKPKTIFTIHNFSHQGESDINILDRTPLSKKQKSLFSTNEFKSINLMKGGLLSSNYITTVSPSYSKELLKAGKAQKNNETLQALYLKKKFFKGILNGIDDVYWDPHKDPFIPFNYSKKNLRNTLPFIKAKEKNKIFLKKKLKLNQEKLPLVSCVTRLVQDKGLAFIKHSIKMSLKKKFHLVILGNCFEESIKKEFLKIKTQKNLSELVSIQLGYNESLSHLIYAASDILLVPSIVEPCGLTQLLAMRYGSIPLVRATGGLTDTVHNYKEGFVFKSLFINDFSSTLNKALSCYKEKPKLWRTLMKNSMSKKLGWQQSLKDYEGIYSKILK